MKLVLTAPWGAEPGVVRAGEAEPVGSVGVAGEGPAAFVDEVVVRPALAGEVVAVGGALVAGPVLVVVHVADGAVTAREPAGAVASLDVAAHPVGDAATAAADADGGAVGALDEVLDIGVTEEAQDRGAPDGHRVDQPVGHHTVAPRVRLAQLGRAPAGRRRSGGTRAGGTWIGGTRAGEMRGGATLVGGTLIGGGRVSGPPAVRTWINR